MVICGSNCGWIDSKFWEDMWGDEDSVKEWLGISWCKMFVCKDDEDTCSFLAEFAEKFSSRLLSDVESVDKWKICCWVKDDTGISYENMFSKEEKVLLVK